MADSSRTRSKTVLPDNEACAREVIERCDRSLPLLRRNQYPSDASQISTADG